MSGYGFLTCPSSEELRPSHIYTNARASRRDPQGGQALCRQRGPARLFLATPISRPQSGPHPPDPPSLPGPTPAGPGASEPVPTPSTRRAWGPLTARSGAGRSRPRLAPSASASPPSSAATVTPFIQRQCRPITAPMAPHLAMGSRARRAPRPLPPGLVLAGVIPGKIAPPASVTLRGLGWG